MDGSGTIRVVKCDGGWEEFDARKLAGAIARATRVFGTPYGHALAIASAVEIFLARAGWRCVSSAAVFEMTVKALRRAEMPDAADLLEAHRVARTLRRRSLRLRHDAERVSHWDKSWLVEFACRSWHLSRPTARIAAGEIEAEFLDRPQTEVSRGRVLDRLNRWVAAAGLADAVPVRQA